MTRPPSALRAPSPRTRGEGHSSSRVPRPTKWGEGGRRPGEGRATHRVINASPGCAVKSGGRAKRMNRVLVALFTFTIAASALAETAGRYIVVPRRLPPSPELRLLRDADSFSSHAVRTYRNATAFAATLTPEEAAELRRSGEVVSVTPVVERHLVDDIGASPAELSPNANYTLRQTVP